MKIALVASATQSAQDAGRALKTRYEWVEPREADVLVALGGDGFMLQTLHATMAKRRTLPVFGMNLGTIGFLMNEYRPERLIERITEARRIDIHPLSMEVRTVAGSTVISPAINEVSLLRETRQTAKIEIAIDGRVRMAELVCDGVLVATPAGSSAYNLSAHGPILPLDSKLLALTPISPFRPRRWRGALLPDAAAIEFRILEPAKRPVSAVADQHEVRDVASVKISTDESIRLSLLFDPEHALDDRIAMEQFLT